MNFETLKKSHLKRNIIIGVVAVLVISAVILNFTRAKYRVTQSIPLVNGTINYSLADLNVVALYIDGIEADELDSTKQYTLDTSQSTCTYKDGSPIDGLSLSYDSNTKAFSITPYTTKGTKCTLYFKETKGASDTIAGLVNTSEEVVLDEAGNARYIGANPNNYVYFNCDDYNNPSTCELWRIIGVFSEDTHGRSGEKLVKLIRSESIGNYAWDSGATNDWTTASLQKSLNGSYLSGTNLESGKGITSATNDMIQEVTWKLGGSSTYNDVTASMFYERERETEVYDETRTTEWTGKIGLMYPSDYGYATSGGSTTNRSSCLAKELYNWKSSSYSYCKNNDWLYDSSATQWTLTPYSSRSSHVFTVNHPGYVYNINAFNSYAVRPSIYLKSNIAISGGDGSIDFPYIIK